MTKRDRVDLYFKFFFVFLIQVIQIPSTVSLQKSRNKKLPLLPFNVPQHQPYIQIYVKVMSRWPTTKSKMCGVKADGDMFNASNHQHMFLIYKLLKVT